MTIAIWYLLEPDGHALLGLGAGQVRLRHLRTDPRTSTTAPTEGDRCTHVSLQDVVEIMDHERPKPSARRSSPVAGTVRS